ncbi:hypothetical protein CL620_03390 [archaeon]|nr:hypothetical protein [archaeon]
MTKTTINGWSLEKHSEFVKKLSGRRSRPVRVQPTTLRNELSKALGYKQYKDFFGHNHSEMVRGMSVEDTWYKYRRGDFL